MYPFERFSEDAKRTLTLAQEEAERSHHSYIGTEHLLLGLLRVTEGRAYHVLTGFGIAIDDVRKMISSVLGRSERTIVQQIIPTSRVKRVIELSFAESRRMGAGFVDTGHLLMGLVIEGEGIAAHVLEDMGVTLERVIPAVEHELGVPPSGRTRADYADLAPLAGQVPVYSQQLHETDTAELTRLLGDPDVARLLAARGVDIAALSRQLGDPPQAVLILRRHLRGIRGTLESAIGARNTDLATRLTEEHNRLTIELDKAEKAWLASLR